jgi:hypothetical protein
MRSQSPRETSVDAPRPKTNLTCSTSKSHNQPTSRPKHIGVRSARTPGRGKRRALGHSRSSRSSGSFPAHPPCRRPAHGCQLGSGWWGLPLGRPPASTHPRTQGCVSVGRCVFAARFALAGDTTRSSHARRRSLSLSYPRPISTASRRPRGPARMMLATRLPLCWQSILCISLPRLAPR